MGIHSALEDRFTHLVLFDTETTGIDPTREEIIEIGAVSITAGEEDSVSLEPKGNTLPVSPFHQ